MGIDLFLGVRACAVAALAAASAAAGVLALALVGDHLPDDRADDDDQHAADNPGCHVLPPLCLAAQMVFVIAVLAHQQVDQGDQHDQRNHYRVRGALLGSFFHIFPHFLFYYKKAYFKPFCYFIISFLLVFIYILSFVASIIFLIE